MVKKLKNIIDILERENKSVWLFALLKMDDITDRWSIIISAPWFNQINQQEQFGYFIELLKKNLDSKELSSIARVGFLEKDEHLVEELLNRKSGDVINSAEQINGNLVHQGEIIISNPDLIWSENQNSLFAKTS